MAYDLRSFIAWIADEFEPAVRLPGSAGNYARQVGGTAMELYGISDMACILYTIGQLRPTETQKLQWHDHFDSLQDRKTGYILEKSPTHHRLHNTAFALGAMNLLDLQPRGPLYFAQEYADPQAMERFLDTLDWSRAVYGDSHRGAGLGSIFALVPELGSSRWFAHYFQHLDGLFDPRNGMLGRNKPPAGDSDQVGGTFHYHFLYEHFHRRMPYPQERIDAIIGLQQPDGYWHPSNHLWLTLDAVYMLTRTVRHSHHRVRDVETVVRRVMDVFLSHLVNAEERRRWFAGNMGVHNLTCVVSLFAEAQQFLGAQEIITDMPLRLVLDRRPFI